MIHTREITDNLDYASVLSQGLIPDLLTAVQAQNLTTKRYSPMVYREKDFSFYGMFMDYVVRAGLRLRLTQPIELGTEPVADEIQMLSDELVSSYIDDLDTYRTSNNMNSIARAANRLVSLQYGRNLYSTQDIDKHVPTLVNICKDLSAEWERFAPYLTGTVRYNSEYRVDNIYGHPDIDTDSAILDIKNSSKFDNLAPASCLQVLAYHALRQSSDSKYVGFLLPMQRQVLVFDVSTWDAAPFRQFLLGRTQRSSTSLSAILARSLEVIMTGEPSVSFHSLQISQSSDNWGSHIAPRRKPKQTLDECVSDWCNAYGSLPCQVFISNPQGRVHNYHSADRLHTFNRISTIIAQGNMNVFIHAPYIINLSANKQDEETGEYWMQNLLNWTLDQGVSMGMKGVVVHTGARKSLSISDATSIMYNMVKQALEHATPNCPLLLETPCGEGTEICWRLEDLGNFCHLFTEEERARLGLCVDTCHVFAAGYDPLVYLQHWTQYVNLPVVLVHFNDSKDKQGSQKDRHAPAGTGHIGMDRMLAVSDWCLNNNIPIVTE